MAPSIRYSSLRGLRDSTASEINFLAVKSVPAKILCHRVLRRIAALLSLLARRRRWERGGESREEQGGGGVANDDHRRECLLPQALLVNYYHRTMT